MEQAPSPPPPPQDTTADPSSTNPSKKTGPNKKRYTERNDPRFRLAQARKVYEETWNPSLPSLYSLSTPLHQGSEAGPSKTTATSSPSSSAIATGDQVTVQGDAGTATAEEQPKKQRKNRGMRNNARPWPFRITPSKYDPAPIVAYRKARAYRRRKSGLGTGNEEAEEGSDKDMEQDLAKTLSSSKRKGEKLEKSKKNGKGQEKEKSKGKGKDVRTKKKKKSIKDTFTRSKRSVAAGGDNDDYQDDGRSDSSIDDGENASDYGHGEEESDEPFEAMEEDDEEEEEVDEDEGLRFDRDVKNVDTKDLSRHTVEGLMMYDMYRLKNKLTVKLDAFQGQEEMEGIKRDLERLVMRTSYLNTVAPSLERSRPFWKPTAEEKASLVLPTADPFRRRRIWLKEYRKRQEEEGDAAEESLDEDMEPAESVRFSPSCTSCMLQGFQCSGHKPICSQCFHSSAGATSALTNASTAMPSTCSYPVQGAPLIPGNLYKALLSQVPRALERKSIAKFGVDNISKAVEHFTVRQKSAAEDGKWQVGFRGERLMDRNSARGVDTVLMTRADVPNLSGNPTRLKRTAIRDAAKKFGVISMEDVATIESTVESKVKDEEKNSKGKWIERVLLLEEDVDQDAVKEEIESDEAILKKVKATHSRKAVAKPAPILREAATLVKFLPDGAITKLNRYRQYDETTLALNKPTQEALAGDAARKESEHGRVKKVRDKGHRKAKAWTQDDVKPADEIVDVESEARSEAGAAVKRKVETESDVVEVDVGGVHIRRIVQGARSKKRKRVVENDGVMVVGEDDDGVVQRTKRVKGAAVLPKYRKRMFKTFRPWIAKDAEKVIPSACDIPETSFLQALHYYASYYYTHANPCPDVFESLDLTSHLALGMILQEVISDFAFKIGMESQVEDKEVKMEKDHFAESEAQWRQAKEGQAREEKLVREKEEMVEYHEQLEKRREREKLLEVLKRNQWERAETLRRARRDRQMKVAHGGGSGDGDRMEGMVVVEDEDDEEEEQELLIDRRRLKRVKEDEEEDWRSRLKEGVPTIEENELYELESTSPELESDSDHEFSDRELSLARLVASRGGVGDVAELDQGLDMMDKYGDVVVPPSESSEGEMSEVY